MGVLISIQKVRHCENTVEGMIVDLYDSIDKTERNAIFPRTADLNALLVQFVFYDLVRKTGIFSIRNF